MTEVRLLTPRLEIRPWRQDEAPLYRTLIEDVGYLCFSLPNQFRADTEGDCQRMLEERRTSFEKRGMGKLPVFLRSTGELLGTCGVDPYLLFDRPEYELGYRFRLSHWGQGYATEAARAVVADFFARHPHPRVVAFAVPQNPGSLKVIEKVGFLPLGKMTHKGIPHNLFEMPRTRWQSLKA